MKNLLGISNFNKYIFDVKWKNLRNTRRKKKRTTYPQKLLLLPIEANQKLQAERRLNQWQ